MPFHQKQRRRKFNRSKRRFESWAPGPVREVGGIPEAFICRRAIILLALEPFDVCIHHQEMLTSIVAKGQFRGRWYRCNAF